MRRTLLVLVLLSFGAVTAFAASLKIVNVNAPKINCVFNPTCKVVVSDTSSPINLGGSSGSGFLQSRTYQGKKGSPGAGLYVYEYRIDLRNVVGITAIPSITSLTIDFGPVVSTLDYDGDLVKNDQVFVVTSGGLGSVAPVSANQSGNTITFSFGAGVGGGSSPGKGESTYFFGLVSTKPPKDVTAKATTANPSGTLNLKARAPNY